MTDRSSRRLTREDWLLAGLDVLTTKGGEAMKAEPMARHLRTTKGSFYWHFRDVSDYHHGLLALWENEALSNIERIREGQTSDVACLRTLAQALSDPEASNRILRAEGAIRAWAAGHTQAAATLARVDAARLDTLGRLLREVGIGNPEMARIIYAAAIGMAGLSLDGAAENRGATGSLVDLVLALR